MEIGTAGERVTIKCENSKLFWEEGNDFPFLPEIDHTYGIRLSQFTLRDMITKTIFSISGNESNGMMTGN